MRVHTMVFSVALVLTGCSGEEEGYQVLPPDAVVEGRTAADLLEIWGKAWLEAPLDDSWFMNLGLCDGGISTGSVYFAPTWPSENEWYATCTMRSEQVLFLVPAVTLCVDLGEQVADTSCLDQSWSVAASTGSIDGEPLEDLEERTVDTDRFDVNLPSENLFGVEAGTYTAIFRGQVVLVEAMPTGVHQVVLSGDFGEGSFAGSLTITLSVAG